MIVAHTLQGLASGEREVYLNLRVDFHRLTVEQIGPVLPLLHSFDRSRSQHRMPADELQVFDVALFADLRLENHYSLNASLAGQRRIGRRHLTNQKTRGHT